MCLNPMLAYRTGKVNRNTGKVGIKFVGALKNIVTPGSEMEQQLRSKGCIEKYYWLCDIRDETDPISRFNLDNVDYAYWIDEATGEVRNRAVILPCGQCIQCRCNKAKEWANRIMLEAQYHTKSYFITLTYDDDHIPESQDKDGNTVYTLRPKDLQDFIKRLRRQQSYHKDNEIRFYAVGEYGSTYHRPHYHMIVFGLVLDDIKEIGRNKRGAMLHDSDTIRRLWQNGITEVDEMTWETAAYCARYTTKKLGKKETDFYKDFGLVPEFSRMSLKPAIGAQYLEDHMDDIYKFDEIFLSTAKGGKKIKPPRYYDDKYDDVYPERMAEIKGNRKEVATKAMKARLARFDGSLVELLDQTANSYINRTKSLRRTLE